MREAEAEQESPIKLPIRLAVKFGDEVELPYEDGVEQYFEKLGIAPFDRQKFVGVTFERVFTVLEPAQIALLARRAQQIDPTYKPPNFLRYFEVVAKPETRALSRKQAEILVKKLRRWDSVEWAYIVPEFSDPTTNVPPNPKSGAQGYLKPAPDGIDSQTVWQNQVPGSDGSVAAGPGLKVIDLERGWNLDHDDLPTKGTLPLSGSSEPGSRDHGTAVLGVICTLDDGNGCIGIAPEVSSVQVISYSPAGIMANVILQAVTKLAFGDVLVLEAQANKPAGPGSAFQHQLPVELNDPAIIDNDPAIFDTIRLASALGVVVIEAAGNGATDGTGGVDLDSYPLVDRANWRLDQYPTLDSGAILVAGGQSTTVVAADGSKRHQRIHRSNFGSRIDCYAWGENVMTAASLADAVRKDLYTGDFALDSGGNPFQIPLFGGTSCATAIVAGAALSVQGMAQAKGFRLSPKQLRAALSDKTPPAPGGPLANTPSDDEIGVMPNLAWVHETALKSAPDLYIRDFVGDTGDPHSGAISASPDVIVQNAAVIDPTAAFGAGSGQENNPALSTEVKAGQDNFIYVRVLNRGPAAAVNVTATVYWSPVATLVTPNLWTPVGSVNIPLVPPNLLTVSGPITWLAANIPARGHYCFVALIGNVADPAPNPTAFFDWANYQGFIRNNNNVTWRNFNVMNTPVRRIGSEDYAVLDFLAPGTPKEDRQMHLDVVAHLPQGARVLLEGPADFLALFEPSLTLLPVDAHCNGLVPIKPAGRSRIGRAIFPKDSRTELRLLVHLPDEFGEQRYDVHVSQFFEGLEVGRVTWSLKAARLGISG